ncbi:MAG: AAA family ATPase [Rhodospirillales bacterium]
MAAELRRLLGRELPLMTTVVLDSYPGRAKMAQLTADQAQLCFLDAASDRTAAFETMAHAAEVCPELLIVALLRSNDPDLILQCLREGASEFLVQPFTSEQLHAALSKLSRFRASRVTRETEPGGRVYCVMPGKGACGATTLACHLAFALKRNQQDRVLLADLDWMTGTTAFLLKLKSSYSFVDALAHAGSLDADLWKALVTPCQGVDVLLPPENPVDGMGETADPACIISYARRAYSAVVLDAGGAYGPWNAALARLCDDLLMVTTNELGALHSVQRARAYLQRNGTDRSKMRVVINRDRNDAGLRRDEIETALQCPVFAVLPADPEAIKKSIIEGKPAAPGSKFAKAVSRLAQQLTGKDGPAIEKKSSGSFLSSFLKRLTG